MKLGDKSKIGSFRVTHHAKERMQQRRINQKQIINALSFGKSVFTQGKEIIYHGSLKIVVAHGDDALVTAMWTPRPSSMKYSFNPDHSEGRK